MLSSLIWKSRKPAGGRPHLGDGAELGHEPAHVVDRACELAAVDDEGVGAGPPDALRRRRGAVAAAVAGLGGAPLARRRQLQRRLAAVALSVTRSQAMAVMRAPPIVSPTAVELLAVRLDVLDHGMARAPCRPTPQSRSPSVPRRRPSGAD